MENKNERLNKLSFQQELEKELVDNRVTKKYSETTLKLSSSQNNLQNKDKCSICKTLNAFNCEHKTPIRDQLRQMFAEDGKYYVPPRFANSDSQNTSNLNGQTNLSKRKSNSDSKLNMPPKPSKKPASKKYPDERVANAYKRKPLKIPSNDNKTQNNQITNEHLYELPNRNKNGIYKLKDAYNINDGDKPQSQKSSKQEQQSQKPKSKSACCSII
jgi:hypothetical protein